MNAEEQIEILRKAGFFQDGKDANDLIEHIKHLETGWNRVWGNYKDLILLTAKTVDTIEFMISAEKGKKMIVKIDSELYDCLDDQIAQLRDLQGIHNDT
jgi:hypothetical protein